jgi:ADP-ribosylglycohydrolase
MFYAQDAEVAIEKSKDSSRTTHGAITAVDACRYFGSLLVGALNSTPKQVLLSRLFCPVEGYWDAAPLTPEIDEIACGSYKKRQPPQIEGTGYVVRSLEAALWAFYNTTTFQEGCLAAVNLGDDADTTGAVYGQLAGAYYGENEIPESWRSKLTLRDLITSYAERLYSHASGARNLI